MTISNAPPVAYVFEPQVDPPKDSAEALAQKLAAYVAGTIIDCAVERFGDNGQQWHGVI